MSQELRPTDQKRKQLRHKIVFHTYSNIATSPLGTDHPALVIHKAAERQANVAACANIGRAITLSDAYNTARKLQAEGDFVAAKEELQKAKALRSDEAQLEAAYNSAADVHLATMVNLLTVARCDLAKREAVKALSASLLAPFVAAELERITATEAPAQRQTITQRSEAPPRATGEASDGHSARDNANTLPTNVRIELAQQGVM
jgi:hypothetical protein